ncbi:MAG: hypothetical protein MZW92_25400 [Comamonadaceae bacterium]|nr:hypothetical protein [Comamonadaceae bacterium]
MGGRGGGRGAAAATNCSAIRRCSASSGCWRRGSAPRSGDDAELELLRALIQSQARKLARYRCSKCGFRAREFHWQLSRAARAGTAIRRAASRNSTRSEPRADCCDAAERCWRLLPAVCLARWRSTSPRARSSSSCDGLGVATTPSASSSSARVGAPFDDWDDLAAARVPACAAAGLERAATGRD